MPNYVVIGPGWGSEYLQPRGPTGRIAYHGQSLGQANRAYRHERAVVRQMRREPGFRDAADTWQLLEWDPQAWGGAGGWVPVKEGVAR